MRSLICILFILFFTIELNSQQVKHALIFAISEYKEGTGWAKLNSHNDVPIIEKALTSRGFSNKNIHKYINKLSKKDLDSLIKKHLIQGVKKGDVVYFHFSGHGQQIASLANEEADGLDETLVPYDAPSTNTIVENGKSKPYLFDKHLRDKELRDLLFQIRKKLGPSGNLFVVIDACHSGGASRNIGKHRGTASPNVPKGWVRPKASLSKPDLSFTLGQKSDVLAPMAVFSASRAEQLNYEYTIEDTTYGPLSYALSQAILKADKDLTYNGLFEIVRSRMMEIAPKQNPLAEGELEQEIFGGKLTPKNKYFTILKWSNDSTVVINAGSIMMVNEGALVGFYPVETKENEISEKMPIVEGKVIKSENFYSVVRISKGSLKKATPVWVYQTKATYSKITLNYSLSFTNKNLQSKWLETIASCSFLVPQKSQHTDLIFENIDLPNGANSFVIKTQDSSKIFEKIIAKDANDMSVQGILNAALIEVKQFAQTQFLRQLNHDDARFNISFEIIPYRFKNLPFDATYNDVIEYNKRLGKSSVDSLEELPTSSIKSKSGDYFIPVGTILKLKIYNQSDRDAFYSLLQISPQNQLSHIVPENGKPPEDYIIKQLDSNEMWLIIDKPIQSNIYKLFACTRNINLKSSLSSRGFRNDTPLNSADDFIKKNVGQGRNAFPELLFVTTIIIQIVEPGQFLTSQ